MCYKCEAGMVSVIIPVYNCQKYILRCLESVSRQSYSKMQIIVVDDGSVDDSYEIIRSFTNDRPEFIVLHKNNGGVSSARNLALKYVSGEYIYFLDADDCLEDNAIEVLVAAMRSDEADWVSCQYSKWGIEGNKLDDYDFITGVKLFKTDEDRLYFAIKQLLRYFVGYEVWNKLYCADRVFENNISFSDTCSIGEDLAFNIKYLMHSQKLSCIEDRCVRYTVRDDSVMGELNSISRKLMECKLLLEDVYDYASSTDNKVFLKGFPLLCYILLDNTYVGYSANEICDGYKKAGEISFIKEIYKEIEKVKDEIITVHGADSAKIKFRYHMFIYHSLTGFSITDILSLFAYDTYRRIKGRQPIEKWRMPY